MNPGLFGLLKLAAMSVQEKLDHHFDAPGDGKKWIAFRRNLRSKSFAEAAKTDPRADKKLKKYVEMVHLHQSGKGPTIKVKSTSSNKSYTVKFHPTINRYSCSCMDWIIKHSVDAKECKHIKQVRSQKDMVKQASMALRELAGLGRAGLQAYRTEGYNEQAWHAGQVNKIHHAIGQERKLRRMG